jgi:hypothetical protein
MILRIAVGWVTLVGVTQTSLALTDAYRSLVSFNNLKTCDGRFMTDGSSWVEFSFLWGESSYFYLSIIGSSTAGELDHFCPTLPQLLKLDNSGYISSVALCLQNIYYFPKAQDTGFGCLGEHQLQIIM